MSCGVVGSTCYSFQSNNWTRIEALASPFNIAQYPKAVTMSTGTFIFGAPRAQFWRKGSDKWEEGPAPHPEGTFGDICVVKINEDNLLVMGGYPTGTYGKKVFKYNVQNMTWTPMPDMKTPRWVHACALFKDEFTSYVLVAGGYSGHTLASTEMYFLNGTVKEGDPMRNKR